MLGLYSQPHVTENIPALLWSSPHGSSHSDSNFIGEPSFVPPESSQHDALGPQAPQLLVSAVTCGPNDITCFLSFFVPPQRSRLCLPSPVLCDASKELRLGKCGPCPGKLLSEGRDQCDYKGCQTGAKKLPVSREPQEKGQREAT